MNLDDVRAFARRGAELIEALHPGEVEIGGLPYACAMGSPLLGGSMMPGGEELEGEMRVDIRKELLPTPPARHTIVTAQGRKWRVKNDPPQIQPGAVWTLLLEPKN